MPKRASEIVTFVSSSGSLGKSVAADRRSWELVEQDCWALPQQARWIRERTGEQHLPPLIKGSQTQKEVLMLCGIIGEQRTRAINKVKKKPG